MRQRTSGAGVIWAGVILLIVLRQDVWFWHDPSLVLGMFPVGLAWQVGISLAAALLWYTATRIAWPADQPDASPQESTPSQELPQ